MSFTLGIWDGHDAGCALLSGDEVVFAVNEERLSRRKLEVGFPRRSIQAALAFAGIRPADVSTVAFTTADPAKTLTRLLPSLREEYYQVRRRKRPPGRMTELKRLAKQELTKLGPSFLFRALSRRDLSTELAALGLGQADLRLVGHHDAHAATAAFFSGFERCLVLTLDGIGDGLSGTARVYESGKFRPVCAFDARASFGLFFEQVTHLLNMRELEDEGKVMALASCTAVVPDSMNPLLEFFRVEGMRVLPKYSGAACRDKLAEILWKIPSEQFAYMAQRTLEVHVTSLVSNLLATTDAKYLAFAGGVAANVKLNLLLRELPGLEDLFIFPHMGDGGQALGAAAWVNNEKHGVRAYRLKDLYWGPRYSEVEIQKVLDATENVSYRRSDAIWRDAARLLEKRQVVAWFEGRMEFGPRALGGRSILALPDSISLRDELNLRLKKRSWYQPYCPVMLSGDAAMLLVDGQLEPNAFMTSAYRTHADKRNSMAGVIGFDGTCRPQILDETEPPATRYFELLREIRRSRGAGLLLNTSFNLHGEPIVCSPEDALRTFLNSTLDALVMDDFLATKRV